MTLPSGRTREVLSYLRGNVQLSKTVEELKEEYQSAHPFPHLVLDDVFLPETLDALIDESPSLGSASWAHEDDERRTKINFRSATDLGDCGYQFTAMLHSAAFLYLLTEISGVKALLPDPYMAGGAYHVYPEGGKFDVHVDRNVDHVTGLMRRIAFLLYLNKNWRHENGGQLELWDQEGTACVKSIEPMFNRVVMFEVGDKNFHGVCPVTAGSGALRRSFVSYYHTVSHKLAPHNSIFAPAIYRDKATLKSRIASNFLPPVLYRALKGVRDQGKARWLGSIERDGRGY
jgi:hypothetical protein